MNTMFDIYGSEAETSYRRMQVTRQYRNANSGRANSGRGNSGRAHHTSPLRRWREARRNHAG